MAPKSIDSARFIVRHHAIHCGFSGIDGATDCFVVRYKMMDVIDTLSSELHRIDANLKSFWSFFFTFLPKFCHDLFSAYYFKTLI